MFYVIDDLILETSKKHKLTLNDMLVFAYVINFIRNTGECTASLKTIADNTGSSKRNAIRSLNKLVEYKLINKKVSTKGNVYTSSAKYSLVTSDKMALDWCQNVTSTSDKMAPNNKYINKYKINNNIYSSTDEPNVKTDYDFYMNTFNDICKDLPKVKALSDTRKKTLKKIDPNEFKQICELVNASDFLSGRMGNKNEWSATFDWIIKPSNRIKILEGNYKNKKGFFEELLEIEK